MMLKFTKMHGLGNDFMVIDGIHQEVKLSTDAIRKLSARNTGIGFDQCLLVEASDEQGIDFFYRIFNSDGQEVGQCGNGARCLARFLQYYQLTPKKRIQVATKTTRMQLILNEDDTVSVNMGKPKLTPAEIPLLTNKQATYYSLPVNETVYEVHAVNVGNPHAVLVVPDLNQTLVGQIGKIISEHPLFPEQVNAGFMHIKRADAIDLRVYERGSGETHACGSGAVAAVVVGRLYHQLAQEVCVHLPGGALFIHWAGGDDDVILTGPAEFVYEGQLLHKI